MTVIPFKRLGNRSTSLQFRGWANARNAMAFASILLIILLYVIWTSTGNTTTSTTSTSSTTLMLGSSSQILSNTGLNSGANNKYIIDYNKKYARAPSQSSSSSSNNKLNINNNNINKIYDVHHNNDDDNLILNDKPVAAAAIALAPILLAAKIAGAENFIVADDHKNSKKFNVIFDKDIEENSHSDNEHILYGNNFDGGGNVGDIDSVGVDINDDLNLNNNNNKRVLKKGFNKYTNIQKIFSNNYNKKINNNINNNNNMHHHSHSHNNINHNSNYQKQIDTKNNNIIIDKKKSQQEKYHSNKIEENKLISNKQNINTNNNNNNHNNNHNNNVIPKSGKTNSQLKVEQSIAAAAAARASKTAVNIIYKKSLPQKTSDKKRNINKVIPDTGIVNDSMDICNENFEDNRQYIQNRPRDEYNHLPIIYFVTPTYPRREQIPELTRLGQTLMHVPRIHWIVADDFDTCNSNLDFLLNTFGVPYTHISSPMPDIYRVKSPNPRGVANRRAALNWIRNGQHKHGVLYFGDDDNTFDLKLFSEIRDTKKVSMFPVGLIGLYAVSSPVVKEGKVIGFFDSWPAKRKWPVDMAGFAVNLQYLSQHPNATMPYRAGYEEDAFLRSISLKIEDIEPKASNCTEILVWHTQTQKSKAPTVRIESKYVYDGTSSLAGLFRELEALNVSHHSDTTGVKAQVSRDGKVRPFSYFFR